MNEAAELRAKFREAEHTIIGMRRTILVYEQMIRDAGGSIFQDLYTGGLTKFPLRKRIRAVLPNPDPQVYAPLDVTAAERRYAWPEIATTIFSPDPSISLPP